MYKFHKTEDTLTGEFNPFYGLNAELVGCISLPGLLEDVIRVKLLDVGGGPLGREGLLSHLKTSFPQYAWGAEDVDIFFDDGNDDTIMVLMEDLELVR